MPGENHTISNAIKDPPGLFAIARRTWIVSEGPNEHSDTVTGRIDMKRQLSDFTV